VIEVDDFGGSVVQRAVIEWRAIRREGAMHLNLKDTPPIRPNTLGC